MNTQNKKYEKAIAKTREYWDQRAQKHQNNQDRIECSRRSQNVLFEIFLRQHDINHQSILDVGCGTGDLLEYLQNRKIDCQYTGCDVSPAMIATCLERFPQNQFITGNLLNWNPDRTFDYTVSFGIHNIHVPNGMVVLTKTLQYQYDICTKAAHMSLLTDRYTGFSQHIQPWRAEDILSLALDITPYVTLRHDYLPHDFSITLYRQPLIDTQQGLVLT